MNDGASKDTPLERYIAILEAIAPFIEGLSAAELEIVLDLPKTTVNRLLHVLIDSGLVSTQNARNRTFKLGDRVLKLIQTSPETGWLVTLAEKPLQMLADSSGQSAFISKFDGVEVKSVTCVAPDTPVRTYVMPGMAMPINATASGKAIMAWQPDEVVDRVLSQHLRRYTERTKVEMSTIKQDLQNVREQGYAAEFAEHVPGLATIAVPIQIAKTPVVYAVGLTGPYNQIVEERFNENCEAIRDTAKRLAKLLQMRGLGQLEA